MELRYENAWNGNGWLYGRVNRLLAEMNQPQVRRPPAEVIEDKDQYRFFFEMPGLRSESIDVRVEGDTLLVAAERKRPEWAQDAEVHVAELAYGQFKRAFSLPEDAATDAIRASYKDGILEVSVSKRPEAKPVKVQVN
ncbi:MAG TPA: HSP20 family small heat-shock protein [Candidatus Binataceae bacterium]|nr:HSP20 family small heat-shock protein [Candidatus Binataceae bacterium]